MSEGQIKYIRMGLSVPEHEEVRMAAKGSRQSMLQFAAVATIEKARAVNEKRK